MKSQFFSHGPFGLWFIPQVRVGSKSRQTSWWKKDDQIRASLFRWTAESQNEALASAPQSLVFFKRMKAGVVQWQNGSFPSFL